jgi:hypothetical protein
MVLKSPLGLESDALLPSVQRARKSKKMEMRMIESGLFFMFVNPVVGRNVARNPRAVRGVKGHNIR